MTIEKKLYATKEVGQLIRDAVHELVQLVGGVGDSSIETHIAELRQWAGQLQPQIEAAVSEEVCRRHVQGVTFSVWSGPPGSGKGTNIDAVALIGKIYAEATSQGVADVLPEPYHKLLLNFSADQTVISTGTRGMFNKPEGEYIELFSELTPVVGRMVALGGFVPDVMVSILVELMVLYRLTQNSHKIQIDLWPRTKEQFEVFEHLVVALRASGAKVETELVSIKVLPTDMLEMIRNRPEEAVSASKLISRTISEQLNSSEYQSQLVETQKIEDIDLRYNAELETLQKLFVVLDTEHAGDIERSLVFELKTVCDRMAYRFKIVRERGIVPRPDEYPLSIFKRLAVFAGDTSPSFIELYARKDANLPVLLVSSAGTPQEVVSDLLQLLSRSTLEDRKWEEIKIIAGEIAADLVAKKEIIVDSLIARVGGILSST